MGMTEPLIHLKIVLEIPGYLIVKMYAVLSHYVMFCAGIWEIIYLYVVLYTFAYEA